MDDERRTLSPRYLFVTGRLAEFALRRLLDDLAPRAGFSAEIAVLPISVAALMTPKWIARHLDVPAGIERVILPGYCRGDLTAIAEKVPACAVEAGPEDLRDLPRHFGTQRGQNAGYGAVRYRDPGRNQPCAGTRAASPVRPGRPVSLSRGRYHRPGMRPG